MSASLRSGMLTTMRRSGLCFIGCGSDSECFSWQSDSAAANSAKAISDLGLRIVSGLGLIFVSAVLTPIGNAGGGPGCKLLISRTDEAAGPCPGRHECGNGNAEG